MATHDVLVAAITTAFPTVGHTISFDELTFQLGADQIIDVLRFCKDDEAVQAELLSDLSGVHWPAGEEVIERQPGTTGWPDHVTSRDAGVIDVQYVLRSLKLGHWLRLAVRVSDVDPVVPSSTAVYPQAANFHEREVFDMFGVDFTDHPNLERILMPEDWIGHPHRKDYPLGGVDIPYKNDKHIPPPNERDLRVVTEARGEGVTDLPGEAVS
ncbi:MAG: NADH-quinone oxidoreductase subunit C [Nitriliruptoraceae bacterium]|jgi:NADH-quinone oxidoreductase subunit C